MNTMPCHQNKCFVKLITFTSNLFFPFSVRTRQLIDFRPRSNSRRATRGSFLFHHSQQPERIKQASNHQLLILSSWKPEQSETLPEVEDID
jgi:hypothetical protein